MKQLNHFNVMTLEGVCLDAGPAPFIVLPYMGGMCEKYCTIYLVQNKYMGTYVAVTKPIGYSQLLQISIYTYSLQLL